MSEQFVNDLISALPVSKQENLEDRAERCELNLKRVYQLEKKKISNSVPIDELHSIWLKDDENFHYLKSQLESWNDDIENCNMAKHDRIEFRNKMYQELGDHLYHVAKTKNQLNQRKYLEDVKYWFEMQLQILAKGKQHTEPTVFQRGCGQANQTIEEQFQHRSKYSDIEPAEDRVKDFGRKYPLQPFTNESFLNPTTRPSTQQGNKTGSNWFTNSVLENRKVGGQFLDRPDSQATNYRFIKSSQSEFRPIPGRNLQSSESQVRPDTQMTMKSGLTNPWNYNNSMNFQNFKPFMGSPDRMNESNVSIKKPPPSMVPDNKNYLDDRMTQLAYDRDNENEFRKNEEIRGTFASYAPNFEEAELRLEQNWFLARNKDLAKKREDEEMLNYMNEWATNKGQYEEEMAKKQQYYLHGSRFHDLDIQKPKKEQHKEVQQEDFENQDKNEEEEEEEELYLKYLKLKNLSKQEKERRQQIIENQNKQDQIDSYQEIKDERYNVKKVNNNQSDKQKTENDDRFFVKNTQESKEKKDTQEQASQQSLNQPRKLQFKDFKHQNFIKADPISKKADLSLTDHNNPPVLPINRALEERKIQTSQGFRRNHSNIDDLEREMKKDKIANIRKMRGHIINQKEEKIIDAEEVEIQRRKDLSISSYINKPNIPFTRPQTQQFQRSKTNTSLNLNSFGQVGRNQNEQRKRNCLTGQFRPFSCIYKKAQDRDNLKKDELQDLKRIKNAFQKGGIRCNAKTLSMAIITPDFVPQQNLAKLPSQGMMLFENKFAQVKKKGKGKKKKK